MDLIDAVQQRHLVHWHDRGFVRTVEPHLYALLPGMRLVLIAFQIAGGPSGDGAQGWKVIDVGDGMNVDQRRTFRHPRRIPPHLLTLTHHVLASSLETVV